MIEQNKEARTDTTAGRVDPGPATGVACPRCGCTTDWTTIEERVVNQRCELVLDEKGEVAISEWGADVGGQYESVTTGVQCYRCYAEWPDIEALAAEIRARGKKK